MKKPNAPKAEPKAVDPVFDFDPSKIEATPEERIAQLMKQMPDTPDTAAPEFEPVKEDYIPADMMKIVEVMSKGGYDNLDAANRALRIMFTSSSDMMKGFGRVHEIIGESEKRRLILTKQRDASDSESKSVALAMRELCTLILGGDAKMEEVITAAERCKEIADNATAGISEYEGNMLSIAINLRALNDKQGPLRGLGTASRERVMYLTNAAAAVLDDARITMLSLKEAAQGLVAETTTLRAQMETMNAVADKPKVVN